MNLSEPPVNSQIKSRYDLSGVTLFWKKPSGGPMRYFIIAFLSFWLCGWFVGFLFAGGTLLTGKGPSAFLAIWLAGWALGGLFAGYTLFQLIRTQYPEAVTLEGDFFKYDTGSAPTNYMNPYYGMRRNQGMVNPFSMMFQKRKIYEFSRAECPEFVLEGLGEAQRLRFDVGADRITIGESLKEPEREWLAQVLNTWKNG